MADMIPDIEVYFFGDLNKKYDRKTRKYLQEAVILDPHDVTVYDYGLDSLEAREHNIKNNPTFMFGFAGYPKSFTKVHGKLSPHYIVILFNALRSRHEKYTN